MQDLIVEEIPKELIFLGETVLQVGLSPSVPSVRRIDVHLNHPGVAVDLGEKKDLIRLAQCKFMCSTFKTANQPLSGLSFRCRSYA